MKKILAALAFLCVFSAPAHGQMIHSIEPNNSLATAQDIHEMFSFGYNEDVERSGRAQWEWVSISGDTRSDLSVDYFGFQAFRGQTYIFDLDHTNFNGAIVISDSDGNVLSNQSVCLWRGGEFINCRQENIDSGSISWIDPQVVWTFDKTDDYFVSIHRAFGDPRIPRWADYELQISRSRPPSLPPGGIEDPITQLPIGDTVSLMAIGLVAMRQFRKRSK